MAVSLTSSGILFPTGNVQNRHSGYVKLYTTTFSGGSTTYSWGSISQSAKRILIMFTAVGTSTGPNSISLTCQNVANTTCLTTLSNVRGEYNSLAGTSGTSVSGAVGGSNLWVSTTYNQFTNGWFELILLEDTAGAIDNKYSFNYFGFTPNGGVTRGNSTLSSGSTRIAQITLATNNTGAFWNSGSASVYQG